MKTIKHLLLAILPLVAISLAGCTKDDPSTNGGNGGGEDVSNFDLKLETAKAGEDSLEILFTPTSDDVPYMAFIIAKADFKDEYMQNPTALIDAKLVGLRFDAKLEGMGGDKFSQYIEGIQNKGTKTVKFDELTYDTAYYVYAYANDKEGKMIGDNFFIGEFKTTERVPFAISLDVKDVTDMTATIIVTPNYTTETYFCNYIMKVDYDAIGGDTKIADYYINLIDKNYNSAYSNFLSSGNITSAESNLVPDTEYVLFAFGLDSKGNITTDIARTDFKTQTFKVVETCTFELTASDINAGSMMVNIKPSSATTRYYVGLTTAKYLEQGYSIPELAASFIDEAEQYDEIDWAGNDYIYTGENDFKFTTMADTEYLVLVFGVSTTGARTTEVGYLKQKTTSVVPSSMTIDMTASDITMNGAKIAIKPSSQTENYYTGFLTYDAYTNVFNSDDSKIIETLVDYYGSSISQYTQAGDDVLDYTFQLVSSTKYVMFAFGFDGGATTGLFKCEFTTEAAPEGVSDAAVAIQYGVVDGATVSSDYANYGILVTIMQGNASAANWYYGASTESLDDMSDSNLIAALQQAGYANETRLYTAYEWGKTVYAATVAIDKNGKAGVPQRYTIPITKDNVITYSAVPTLSSVKRMMDINDIKAKMPADKKVGNNTARVFKADKYKLHSFNK